MPKSSWTSFDYCFMFFYTYFLVYSFFMRTQISLFSCVNLISSPWKMIFLYKKAPSGKVFLRKIKTNLTPEGVEEINKEYTWHIKLGTYQVIQFTINRLLSLIHKHYHVRWNDVVFIFFCLEGRFYFFPTGGSMYIIRHLYVPINF